MLIPGHLRHRSCSSVACTIRLQNPISDEQLFQFAPGAARRKSFHKCFRHPWNSPLWGGGLAPSYITWTWRGPCRDPCGTGQKAVDEKVAKRVGLGRPCIVLGQLRFMRASKATLNSTSQQSLSWQQASVNFASLMESCELQLAPCEPSRSQTEIAVAVHPPTSLRKARG